MLKKMVALTCAVALSTGAAWVHAEELKTAPPPFAVKVEIKPATAPQTSNTSAQKTGTQAASKAQPKVEKTVKKSTEKKIGVNIASRILTLYEGDTKIKMYPVGVGRTSTPTPTGFYKVQNKEVNPTWIDPDDTSIQIASGPDNPIGYRWIGFHGNYGIHGTNNPGSIGGYVSNGCIRMKEPDVEDLYQYVSIGTPVTVYYDRLVIDVSPEHAVSYYVYPDGYGWQALSVAQVKKALVGYGVEDFAEFKEISDKINRSDGNVTYVAKAYDLVVNGTKLSKRALGKNDQIYLPSVAVATALDLDLRWNPQQGILTSPYGIAPGYVKSDVVYVNAANAYSLFHLNGSLTPDYVYNMYSVKGDKTPTVVISRG